MQDAIEPSVATATVSFTSVLNIACNLAALI
jgi:hypothetical protein